MVKRTLDGTEQDARPAKRLQHSSVDRLSQLSDELLLRILSHVSVSTLGVCQRLSYKFYAIAGDSQLWKAAYYNRFVRPRASRLPGLRDTAAASDHLYFSSKLSKWLDEENLVMRGKETNWKRQYKLRHNWSKGSCDVSEIQVAEQPPVPPLLVRLHDGILYTADSVGGLRAWSSKKERKLVASVAFDAAGTSPPTSLAVDMAAQDGGSQCVAVGFQDGSFSIYELRKESAGFSALYTHAASSNGALSALAYASPYLLTMTAGQLLSLYKFETEPENRRAKSILDPPRLLHSLKSHTVWPPLSLSIRPSPQSITASIAYAFPTYFSGWSVGIQEMRLALSGDLLESRLASSTDQIYRPLSSPPTRSTSPSPDSSQQAGDSGPGPIRSKPTSLSYTHPYLLVSHPDNTLTLYLVTSTAAALAVGPGSRLWGHTSAVSGAHVGGRGRAVSVSSRGGELRVWELEGGLASPAGRRRLAAGDLSVRVRPERRDKGHNDGKAEGGLDVLSEGIAQRGVGLGLAALERRCDERAVARGWVGFDEENVVVLRDGGRGGQALVVYDFT